MFLTEEDVGEDEDAEPVAVLAGVAVATALNPPVTALPLFCAGALEPSAFAALWNAAKVFDPLAGALMLPTMPCTPQCVSCLQWNQIGSWSLVILMVY